MIRNLLFSHRMQTGMAAFAAILCFALFAIRAGSAFSWAEPLQVHATGDEFTNYFNIWKAMTGLPVYTDRFTVPFEASVYNWLFYYSYAGFSQVILGLFGLSDMWLPTASRLFSLLATVACWSFAYKTLNLAAAADGEARRFDAALFAMIVSVGPLLGFWAVTVRADLWAMALEMLASLVFLRLYRSRPLVAVLLAALLVYAAWSFKQGNIYAAAGVGLVLLLRRDWKSLAVFCVVLPTAWFLTLSLGDPQWANNILFRDFPLFMSWQRLLRNVANVAAKIGPVLLGFLLLAAWLASSRKRLAEVMKVDAAIFAGGGIIAALLLSVPVSAQHGGAENYYFTLTFYMALFLFAARSALSGEPVLQARLAAAIALGWLVLSLSVLSVLTGVVGITSLRPQHRTYMEFKQCSDSLPRPFFMPIPYMGLPWMTPGNTPWVLSYTYHEERQLRRKPFENDGVGGMISAGAFSALAFPEDSRPQGWDGADARQYQLVDWPQCRDFSVYLRRP